jgi:membrane protein YqaA with SNARE-associated domain
VFSFQIVRALVQVRLRGIKFAQHDLASAPHLELGAGAARNHDALEIADLPQLTFIIRHGLDLAVDNHGMRSFSAWIVALFASPVGVIVLAALDSTLFFSLPFGIDAVVVILAARLHRAAWIVPILATTGSVAGAWLTFWMGGKVGEAGLERYVSARRLTRVRARIQTSGAIALAVLDLIPPPFPFTPFVLAAGALDVAASTFFITLAVCRLLRFGLEAALAALYGGSILALLDSEIFHRLVTGCILLAVALTLLSLVKIVRTSGRPKAPRVPA